MRYDYLIIGQGICGTWLSYYLLQKNKSVFVIDEYSKASASQVASGLINPVTGRRVVTTWMADELLPFAYDAYKTFDNYLNIECIQQKDILVFPSAPDLYSAFKKRLDENNKYIHEPSIKKETLLKWINFPFDVMQIDPCYLINVRLLLSTWRNKLISNNIFSDEKFNEEDLILFEDHVQYKNIQAEKIIYCNGTETAKSKYWKNLPFVQNKGEALIAEIDDLDRNFIYKLSHISIIPWQNNSWWIGSNNELNFTDTQPSQNFYNSTVAILSRSLKVKFGVTEHLASVRPAAVERRPFAGIHPAKKQIVILNGMGSKGCSLAPWFANELAENLIYKKTINTLADVNRYANILKR